MTTVVDINELEILANQREKERENKGKAEEDEKDAPKKKARANKVVHIFQYQICIFKNIF
jgi:hypothetical protein